VSGKRAREAPHKTSNCFVRGFCLHKKLSRLWENGAGMEQDRTISKKSPLADKLLQNFSKKQLTTPGCADIINHVVRHGTNIWGISSAGSPVEAVNNPRT